VFRAVAAATALWAVFLCAPAAAQTCAPRDGLLRALNDYGERLIEHGVDSRSETFVGVTASKASAWSFVMSPRGQPHVLCIVGTGTQWTMTQTSSYGLLADGSLVTIVFDDAGDWTLTYMPKGSATPQLTAGGHGWTRLEPGEKI
jgi:hypothetical protein